MIIRPIENLELGDIHWKFNEYGISYLLVSPGRRFDDQKVYVLKSTEISNSERYNIFGGGNLLKDNEAKIHFVLNKIGTNELYIISADDLNNEMIEIN
jgi:hypothetical protein